MTIAPPNLAGVRWVALPDPPVWSLHRDPASMMWSIWRDGAPSECRTSFASKRRATDQLHQMQAGWWSGWYVQQCEWLANVAELDAATVHEVREASSFATPADAMAWVKGAE